MRAVLSFVSICDSLCWHTVHRSKRNICITPKYLSQVARTITNLPASQWIQFYAAFELVSLLNDTTKTLTEVSDLMHFENISHFSRYVKKTLGKTPSAYRQK